MPLEQLSEYIQRERRAPSEYQSVERIKQQGGHNMTEPQVQLLEKIEELTLYTLEQERKLLESAPLKVRRSAVEAALRKPEF